MRKRITAVLVAVILLLCCLPVSAAGNAIDIAHPASLTISYIENAAAIPEARFDLFCVALLSENGSYELTPDYSSVPLDLSNMSEEKFQSLSETVSVYTQLYKITPLSSEITDSEGIAKFSALKAGLYLVFGHDLTLDGISYSSKPFLIYLPSLDSAGGEWIYDVTASPKSEQEPECPDCEKISRKVLKIWCDGSDPKRPEEITVYLLSDGEIYDTVFLNSENNWRYSWDGLDPDYDWTVAEEVPEGYTVSISLEGITYVILNTSTTPPPPPDTTTPPPDLPQTGQLWWPVPILLIIGIFLIFMGFISRRRVYYDE